MSRVGSNPGKHFGEPRLRIDAIHFAVMMRLYIAAARRPPRSEPQNSQDFRPSAITRKNALFAGSDGGGRAWATIATLLTTAKINGVDPHAWAKLTLERIATGWPNRDLDALMPWNYQAQI